MTEPNLELRSALLQIDERWDDERTRLGVQRAQRSLRVRRKRRVVLAGAGMALMLLAVGWQWHARLAPTSVAGAGQLRLADGSQVLLLDADSRVQVTLDSRERTLLELVRGRARFEVVPRPERVFRVQSGSVAVQVLGTVFEVQRADPATHVRVTRGRVSVESAEGQAVLSAGEAGWFPRGDTPTALPAGAQPSDEARSARAAGEQLHNADTATSPSEPRAKPDARVSVAEAPLRAGSALRPTSREPDARAIYAAGRSRPDDARESDASAAPRQAARSNADPHAAHPPLAAAQLEDAGRAHSASSTPAAGSSWRDDAAHGDYARAYAQLQARGPAPSAVEELLLAADAARLSGHPEAALPYLERVVRDHPRDSRAALAAFTLGGVLLEQLARPAEAEAAYARARALALHASLAQDALARQVEAAQRAGDSARARSLATEYVARYPDGRRIHAVRRFGGLSAQ